MTHATEHSLPVPSLNQRLSCCLLLVGIAIPTTGYTQGKNPTEVAAYECAVTPCDLVVDTTGELTSLSWDPYIGEFDDFGYDVHYTDSSAAPPFADNASRIRAGGGTSYIDPTTPARCGGFYHIRAYSKARKKHTPALSASTGSCGPADTISPVVIVDAPAEGAQLGASQLISGTVIDDGGSGLGQDAVTISLFDSVGAALPELTATPMGSAWSVGSDLPEGTYSLSVTATDGAGNTSEPTAARTFTVVFPTGDDEPPVLLIAAPATDGEELGAPQSFGGTAEDTGGSGVSAVSVRVADAFGMDVFGPTTIPLQGNNWSLSTNLPNGSSYTLNVDANDAAGNAAVTVSRTFDVLQIIDIGADGYPETAACGTRDQTIMDLTSEVASWSSEFDPEPGTEPGTTIDIHAQLAADWKSRYEWRQSTTDVVTNNESQHYLDVLGYDSGYRDEWSPFVRLENGGEGYLAIKAAKTDVLMSGPVINDLPFNGQSYLSGVLTTQDTHPLSVTANGKITIEMRARMPEGQGVFPALWLYPTNFAYGSRGSTKNSEIDIIERIGQTPCDIDPAPGSPIPACTSPSEISSGWKRPDVSGCTACANAGRANYDTFHTQYHNYHTFAKGKLKSLGGESSTGAIYTNPDSSVWWRDSWAGCTIDFSEKFHLYTLEWSEEAIVWYIDHIEVLRLDEATDNDPELARVDFVPVVSEDMTLIVNFALGSNQSFIGAPDAYTEALMDTDKLNYIIDYIRVW